ncbi:MAG: four helix bundle protein [Phycisphaerae bacterium]|nr:four helix bundle protein [Phycisphaerae bacterium]
MNTYRDLIVWQKSMDMVKHIYHATKRFPEDERFGLTNQIRRAAVSVPSNIAEGYGRNSTQDYVRFLRMATGSLYEIQTQLEIARCENYLAFESYDNIANLLIEIEKMLVSLTKKIAKH